MLSISYVRDLRYTYQTDWAFAMFVANGDTFIDGNFAWAMGWNDRHFLGQPIGRDHAGDEVTSGIYFYRLQAGEYQEVRKMVVVK